MKITEDFLFDSIAALTRQAQQAQQQYWQCMGALEATRQLARHLAKPEPESSDDMAVPAPDAP